MTPDPRDAVIDELVKALIMIKDGYSLKLYYEDETQVLQALAPAARLKDEKK